MRITTRKVLQAAYIAGALLWFANAVAEMIHDIRSERKIRKEIDAKTDMHLDAIKRAEKIISEDIKAGHYDGRLYAAMTDFQDLVMLYASEESE